MKERHLKKQKNTNGKNNQKLNTFLKYILLINLISFNIFASEQINSTNHTQSIVLGSGCFWGAEKGYESLPGVIEAISGYADEGELDLFIKK